MKNDADSHVEVRPISSSIACGPSTIRARAEARAVRDAAHRTARSSARRSPHRHAACPLSKQGELPSDSARSASTPTSPWRDGRSNPSIAFAYSAESYIDFGLPGISCRCSATGSSSGPATPCSARDLDTASCSSPSRPSRSDLGLSLRAGRGRTMAGVTVASWCNSAARSGLLDRSC